MEYIDGAPLAGPLPLAKALQCGVAFVHGPLPMRLRASVGRLPVSGSRSTLTYARHVLAPAPTAAARLWHSVSAPRRPPRLPVTLVALVTKKLSDVCGEGVGLIVPTGADRHDAPRTLRRTPSPLAS